MSEKLAKRGHWTPEEDKLVMSKGYKCREIAAMLGRTTAAVTQRRMYLRNGGEWKGLRAKKKIEPYRYSNPLDALFEPELPKRAYEQAERWWHLNSPPSVYDRDQAQLSFLAGYMSALAKREGR